MFLSFIRSVIKRQTSQTASDYERLRVTTSDSNWLRARLRVTTSNYEPDYEWLQATASGYEWLRARRRVTTSDQWLHNNERIKFVENCSKYSCATLLVKISEKYFRCRSSRWQVFFKVSVLKKAFSPAVLLQRYCNTMAFSVKIARFLRTPFFIEHLRWQLLAMGAPYLVKLEVTFFIKKLNFIHQGFLPQFKKIKEKISD